MFGPTLFEVFDVQLLLCHAGGLPANPRERWPTGCGLAENGRIMDRSEPLADRMELSG